MQVAGVSTSLRAFVAGGGAVTVTASDAAPGHRHRHANGILTYKPNANANGVDNVLYTVTVNGQVSNQAQVVINVTPVNDLPVAGNHDDRRGERPQPTS